ncbi:MAG: response regulator transcription factor [Bacteroidetes bacterium]|nr:response regulator transcription factor [Bacteroidota bacterium]
MSTKTTYSIAIADDHAILRSGLKHIINSLPEFSADIEASNGKELIEKIESADKKPDVCIIDINMPLMNGYKTAQAIRTKWPGMGILALSQYNNEYSVIKMLRSGATGYLPKEAGPKELEDALFAIINKSIYYSDLVSEKTVAKAEDRAGIAIDLNETDLQFLGYCSGDLTYKEIAEKMKVSLRTVDWYRDKLFEKLKVKSRTGLAVFALQVGIAPIG